MHYLCSKGWVARVGKPRTLRGVRRDEKFECRVVASTRALCFASRALVVRESIEVRESTRVVLGDTPQKGWSLVKRNTHTHKQPGKPPPLNYPP